MGFLIDTSLWIAVERGVVSPASVHAVTGPQPIDLSPVNIAEVCFGIGLMTEPATILRAKAALRRMRCKPLLRITAETGEVFGNVASKLRQSGRGADFRVQDVWLAAQAIQRDFGLLTANEKDFKDIPGLKWVALEAET